MIIDFHTHIFPNAIRENKEKYFKKEPAFKLLYQSPNAKMAGADELITDMNKAKVNISVIFGFPWKDMELTKMHNDYIIESVKKYKNRLCGFACFDMYNSNGCKEAQRCVEAGLSGVGELACYESELDNNVINKLKPTARFCKDKDIAMMIHTNEPIGHQYPGKIKMTLSQIYNLAKNFSENKIILAHWGGGIFFYNLCKKETKDILKNIYFDTAASPFLYDDKIYKSAVDIIGSEKILFGTDYPLLKAQRYFKEINSAELSEKDIKNILGDNAAALIKGI
ncbi:MAG: amidohydrolase family protein [Deltaproteobacteria bacterium]|nr:amidohydrolase family protein [Deltaproteobacteria bacterium]